VRLRVIAVGSRMPDWVVTAVDDYARRLRGAWKLEIREVTAANRRETGGEAATALREEAQRILPLLQAGESIVALDERGQQWSTAELSRWLGQQRDEARDITFIIGGPDGLSPEVLGRSTRSWSLSRLTLPHPLVRVLLIEQLYRAASVLAGHPYHRA
jgi:23S rRNA (pseudouridine1915-N3)-methyltransferase